MISGKEIGDILSLYAKHGWILRRVLLSDNLRESLTEDLFGGAEIVSSNLDALWFSRASNSGEAWELRHLSNTPFALVEVFPEGTSSAEREETIKSLKIQLSEWINKKHIK